MFIPTGKLCLSICLFCDGMGGMLGWFVVIVLLLLAGGLLVWGLRQRGRGRMAERKLSVVRDRLFRDLAHECCTPLTVMNGVGGQLQEAGGRDVQQVHSLGEVVSRQSAYLLELVGQWLDYTRISSGMDNPEWCRYDVVPFLRAIVDSLYERAHEQNVDFTFQTAKRVVEMDFVPDYVQRILTLLLLRAFRVTPRHGRIAVAVAVEKQQIVLTVADNGAAPDAQTQAVMCDLGDSTVAACMGTGLVLARQCVETMHGFLSVARETESTVFTVRLPLVQKRKLNLKTLPADVPVTVPACLPPAVPALMKPEPAEGNLLRVLIVEENTDAANLIGQQLSSTCRIAYAHNGQDGFEKAEQLVPDLIITDLIMPVMDGYELCRRLRSSEITLHIPIVVLTVRSQDDDRIRCLEAGADDFIVKPFNAGVLNARVSMLCQRNRVLRERFSQADEAEDEKEVEELEALSPDYRQFLDQLTNVSIEMMKSGHISLDDVAGKLRMSRVQLNRKVRQITGDTTTNYVMRIRMNRARRLLRSDPSLSIYNVAWQCGFEDMAYFSRIFKRLYNITPSQYRKQC